MFCLESKTFLLPGQKFCVRNIRMFPSLATLGNITRTIVSATMFPSLARPLVKQLWFEREILRCAFKADRLQMIVVAKKNISVLQLFNKISQLVSGYF